MIKKATVPADLKGLLVLEDDVEKYIPCTRTEWVQWLVQVLENKLDKVGIWVEHNEEGKVIGYAVALDAVILPISKTVAVIYTWAKSGRQVVKDGLALIEEWAIDAGAEDLTIATEMPRLFIPYGFLEHPGKVMHKRLVK